jgi:hypothetical protein
VFEASLKEKLTQIFDVKVSFDDPGDTQEQGILFVEVEDAPPKITDGFARFKVSGSAKLFGKNNELTFGYFGRKLAQAEASLKKDFFFSDFEKNTLTYRNLVQRGFNFIYFFKIEYDPSNGTLEEIEFIQGEP